MAKLEPTRSPSHRHAEAGTATWTFDRRGFSQDAGAAASAAATA